MKSDANKVLLSGWGVFLVISLLVSVALDIANPGVNLPSGTRINFVKGGSATLGWLVVISIFILPSYLLRSFAIAPINRWIAVIMCFVGFVIWTAIHTVTEPNSHPRFNFTMWGCVILAWHLLTKPRIEISDDEGVKLAVPDDSSLTKLETQIDLMSGRSEKNTIEISQNFTHAESLKIGSHKKKWMIGGVLIILLSFGVHGFVEDESPNLSWCFICCGIWASLAYLAPDDWLHFPRLQVNWKKVMLWAGCALLITAFIAGLALLMKAFEHSAKKSAQPKAEAVRSGPMLIDETMAWQVWQAFPTLDEDRKKKAAVILSDYRAQQTAAGMPLWPSQEAARAQKKKRVYDVFDDPLILDVDDGRYVQAERVQPGLGDKLRKREASILWLANRYGADESDVRERLDYYKAAAGAKWGVGLLDDDAFFAKVKADIAAESVSKPNK